MGKQRLAGNLAPGYSCLAAATRVATYVAIASCSVGSALSLGLAAAADLRLPMHETLPIFDRKPQNQLKFTKNEINLRKKQKR